MADDIKQDDVLEESNVTIESVPVFDEDTATHKPIVVPVTPHQHTHEPSSFRQFWNTCKNNKKISIPAVILSVIAIALIVPTTRYSLLGLIVKRDVNIIIYDSLTKVPVSGVEISLRGVSAKSDGDGKVKLSGVRVGKSNLKATKKHYIDTETEVLVGINPSDKRISMEATGVQLPLRITNKITGEAVAGAVISINDTQSITDNKGSASIVLPATDDKQEAIIKGEGFNDLKVQLSTSELSVEDNSYALTPVGKIYFLSKQSGKIDVVKTDLDGSNRQVALAGTGNETDASTILLASRDWKYLALHSKREDRARIYLIDTTTDELIEIDSGDVEFSMVGWLNNNLIYSLSRNNTTPWQPNSSALKSFNASNKQLTTIDETNAEGTSNTDYAYETISNIFVIKDGVFYTKSWFAGQNSLFRLASKRMGIWSTSPSGSNKQLLKDFDIGNNGYISALLPLPNQLVFGVFNSLKSYYEFNDGKLTETDKFGLDSFAIGYPTYLLSPGNNYTFWHEPRDGKNSILVGNSNGKNSREIANLSQYSSYGWYGDEYLLLSKDGHELFIQSADYSPKGIIIKISDYHKSDQSFSGYGYGYGGL